MNKHNRFVDISGEDEYGRAKANIIIRHNLSFSDGRTTLVQEHVIYQKPLVSVARLSTATNLQLVFESNDDVDLSMVWQLLKEYSDPANSVNWTAEEIESGEYIDADGDVLPIYYHTLDVILVPVGHEEEYLMAGQNPVMYMLRPSEPSELVPNVLEMVFNNEWFVVQELEQEDAEIPEDEVEETPETASENGYGNT